MTIRRARLHAILTLVVLAFGPAWAVLGQQVVLDKSLFDASCRGNAEEVARLLKAGGDPNVITNGSTPLHKAAGDGHLDVMRLLIDHKADVKAKNSDGWSTLAYAAGTHKPDATKLLLEAGVEPDGFALGQAGWLGRIETVKLLLKAGANPDDGLVRAAMGGHIEVVKLLLAKGADINTTAQSNQGDTALHTAALQGGFEVVKLLLKHGADPNAVNNEGQTPLHRAISGDSDLARVKLLVEAGAKLDIPDKKGVTPVRLAGTHARGGKAIYDWLLAAAGGKEPSPARPARPAQADGRSTKDLLSALSGKDYKQRMAAEQELIARGKEIVPDIVKSLDSGQPLEQFSKLLVALGPEAEAAVPKVESLLTDKKQALAAALTLHRMKPSALGSLPEGLKQRTATTLHETIVDPQTQREMAGWHLLVLIQMDEVAVPHVLNLLRSENPELRYGAAELLAVQKPQFTSEEITVRLIELSRDKSQPSVRQAAALALGRFSEATPEVRAALLAILKNPPPYDYQEQDERKRRELRDWEQAAESAARSLARFGPSVIDELVPQLSPIGAPHRMPAITALSSLGPDAIPRLTELAAHQDKAVAVAAQIALGKIRSSRPNLPANPSGTP